MWPTLIIQFLVLVIVIYISIQKSELDIMDFDKSSWIISSFGIFSFLVVLATSGINIYLYFKKGETLGYRLMGLRVVSEKTGEKPTTGQLWSRFGVKALFLYIPYINLIGPIVLGLWIAFSKKKQGPHDLAASTLVVRIDKKKGNILVVLVPIFLSLIPVLAGVLFMILDPRETSSRSQDGYIKSNLGQIPTIASLENPGSFENVCKTPKIKRLIDNSVKRSQTKEYICNSNQNEFIVAVKLNQGNKWACSDVNGLITVDKQPSKDGYRCRPESENRGNNWGNFENQESDNEIKDIEENKNSEVSDTES